MGFKMAGHKWENRRLESKKNLKFTLKITYRAKSMYNKWHLDVSDHRKCYKILKYINFYLG